MRVELGFVAFDVTAPQVGRTRALAAASLSTTASGLWIGAPVYLPRLPLVPDAELSALTILAGISIPAAVAFVTLLLMERRILRDLKPAERAERPEPAEVMAR